MEGIPANSSKLFYSGLGFGECSFAPVFPRLLFFSCVLGRDEAPIHILGCLMKAKSCMLGLVVCERLRLCRVMKIQTHLPNSLLLHPSAFAQSIWITAAMARRAGTLSMSFLSPPRSRKDSLESESSAAIIPHELIRTRQLESVHLKFNQESGALIPLCLRWERPSSSSACN